MDSHKLTQRVTAIAVAIPDVALLLEQTNTSPGTLFATIDLENAFSTILVNKDFYQRQFALTWQGQQYTFTVVLLYLDCNDKIDKVPQTQCLNNKNLFSHSSGG